MLAVSGELQFSDELQLFVWASQVMCAHIIASQYPGDDYGGSF